jgi:2-polyprenyl-3-methyl-5-hydroxy-6-metoxy-1,4-benzoquinol methylase
MHQERISNRYANDRYFAHLSVYYFVSRWSDNKTVLDAGCGSGYGSVYLAQHGAKMVYGIDASKEAILSNQKRLEAKNVTFSMCDLRTLDAFSDEFFDIIVASNSLEHVEGVDRFFLNAGRVLKKTGILIVAVPAPRNQVGVDEELSNPYHLNIWSPQRWFLTQKRYMGSVRCFKHIFTRTDISFLPRNTPDQTIITEKDFVFQEIPLEQLQKVPTLSSVFVTSEPLPKGLLPKLGESLSLTDYSVTRQMHSTGIRLLVWLYYRISFVLRHEGFRSLLLRIKSYIFRSFWKFFKSHEF